MPRLLKLFVGNYDGLRRGLVITTSKVKATEIGRCSVGDINRYWGVSNQIPDDFKAETLYTCKMFAVGPDDGPWMEGKCPVE